MPTKELKPLKRGNLSEGVYTAIRDALVEGRYEPGERLRISRLAEDLGVSITPVREAIFRLVADHALEMKAATAIHVPELTADQLREIQTIRLHLEGEAAALAAVRISDKELAELEDIHRKFQNAAATDPVQASNLNRQFHFAVLAAARSPMIFATVENMWVLMGPLLRMFHLNARKRDLTSTLHPHFEVIEALRAHDAERAREAVKADVALGLSLVDWIEKRALESAQS